MPLDTNLLWAGITNPVTANGVSNAVNLLTGTPRRGMKAVIEYSAASQSAAALTVSAVTNASPMVVTTTAAHGLSVGQVVTISGANGAGAALINGTWFVIAVGSTTTFTLGSAWDPITQSGTNSAAPGVASTAGSVAPLTQMLFSLDKSADGSNWDPMFAFQLDESDNAGFGGSVPGILLSATAQAGVAYIPFETSAPYVRLHWYLLGGTSPTVTLGGGITIGRPY